MYSNAMFLLYMDIGCQVGIPEAGHGFNRPLRFGRVERDIKQINE